MPNPATLLLLAALIPLCAFVVLALAGRRMGMPLAGWLSTGGAIASAACSVLATVGWLGGGTNGPDAWGLGRGPITMQIPWIVIEPPSRSQSTPRPPPPAQEWSVGVHVDSLTVTLVALVTACHVLIGIYASGFFAGRSRGEAYFAAASLQAGVTIGAIIGSSLLLAVACCVALSASSWLLTGAGSVTRTRALAAWIARRPADALAIAGMALLGPGQAIGTLQVAGVVQAAGACLLAAAAVVGVGLAPVRNSLNAAARAAAPAGAEIHGVSVVIVAVYLLARVSIDLPVEVSLVIGCLGAAAMVGGTLIAVAQTDIRVAISYIVGAQVGLVAMGLAVGSWVDGLFHLVNISFAVVALFLGYGTVVGDSGLADVRQFGGLLLRIPVTAVALLVATLSLSAMPPLSGNQSTQWILSHLAAAAKYSSGSGASPVWWAMWAAAVVGAYLTPAAVARLWVLTFMGQTRSRSVEESLYELPTLYLPLCALALFCVVSGNLLGVRATLGEHADEVTAATGRAPAVWSASWSASAAEATDVPTPQQTGPERRLESARSLTAGVTALAPFAGLFFVMLLYFRGPHTAGQLLAIPPLGRIHRWLADELYLEELTQLIFGVGLRSLAAVLAWARSPLHLWRHRGGRSP